MTSTQPVARHGLRLSFVIPTHNRRDLVLRAVDSIFAQNIAQDIEVIVVDDGSTDDTEVALHQRFPDHPLLRVITTAHRHANAARNTGFNATQGELVCFLDSDDFWTPHTWSIIEQAFAHHPELTFLSVEGSTLPSPNHLPLARVVAGDAPGWSDAGFRNACLMSKPLNLDGAPNQLTLLHGDYFPAIIHGDLFMLSGLVIRRGAVERAGPFTEHFHFYNDWEFFARLCLQGVGGYLNYEGFRRDAGRGDQISRGRPSTAMPRRHVYILRSLLRHSRTKVGAHAGAIEGALDVAQYWLARRLLGTRHRRFARSYLIHCLRRRYKPVRSLVLLVASILPTR
ncbi:MAG: glycosyltransferase family 2 protein [Rhodanobacter sp.]